MQRWELPEPGLQNMALRDAPRPVPGPGEVLVKIQAVSLNDRDLRIWDGETSDHEYPYLPGGDFAGEVVELGPLVSRFSIGDHVIGAGAEEGFEGHAPSLKAKTATVCGHLAEFAAVSEERLVAAPETLGAVAASTLPSAGLTAWMAVVEAGGVRAGQTWVVHGTNAISLFALQFATAHGADVVMISNSDEKVAFGLDHGARLGVNYLTNPRWDREVIALTKGRGADAVVEAAAGDNLTNSLNALATGGRILLVDPLRRDHVTTSVRSLIQRRATLNPIGVGPGRALEEMIRAIDSLAIEPVVDAIYDWKDLPAAAEHLRRGAAGKIVVRVWS